MEQDGDVVGGEAERLGRLFSGDLLEHAQRDDLAMDVAQLRHATDELVRGDGVGERVVGARRAGDEVAGGDVEVGAGEVVAPPQVAGGVAHDGGEQARRVVGQIAQAVDVGAGQEGVERILDDIERVGGAGAFAARDGGESTGVVARESGDPVAAAAGRCVRHPKVRSRPGQTLQGIAYIPRASSRCRSHAAGALAGGDSGGDSGAVKTPFIQRLRTGQPLVGILLTTGSTEIAEVIQAAGFDWVFIDGEHGVMGPPEVQGLLQVLAVGPPALVRIPENDAVWYKKALDAGADGVIVPLVRTVDDARRAVAYAKYPPVGARSVGIGRAHGYGARFKDYVETANESVALVLQIEHIDAVNQLDEILAVPGIDAAFVGPFDLSASMGLTGQVRAPAVREAIAQVQQRCAAREIPVGIFATAADAAAESVAAGFNFVAIGTDLALLSTAAGQLVQGTRGLIARRPGS
jgi:2-keto-3-deoxy-L-rhamnonate aldolase RhmA